MSGTKQNQTSTAIQSEHLRSFLADTYSLFALTQGCHWNVTGAQFASLHLLFQQQYTELSSAIDDIAERLRSLGQQAPGTLAELTARARPNNDTPRDANTMLLVLSAAHRQLALDAGRLVPLFDDMGDGPSVDLINARRAAHEKATWMLDSHCPHEVTDLSRTE